MGSSYGYLPNSQYGYDWQSWLQGSLQLPVTWTNSGTYQLTLYVGNDCGIDSMVNEIIVTPKAIIPDITYSICSGSSFSYNPTTGNPTGAVVPPNTTYTWTVAAGTSSSLANVYGWSNQSLPGIAGPISQTLSLAAAVTTQQQVIYTVTPHTISGTTTCDGLPFTITVNVIPEISIPDVTITICNNSSFSLTPTYNNPPTAIVPSSGMLYTWTVINSSSNINEINGELPGSGTTISGTLSLNPSATINYTQVYKINYLVIASGDPSCPTDTFILTVKINAIDPGIISPDTITICQNSTPFPVFNQTTSAVSPGTGS